MLLDASSALQAALQSDLQSTDPTDIANVINDSLPRFGSDHSSGPVQFLVWGDSHAKVSIPAFDALGKRFKVSVSAAIWFSTPPLVGEENHLNNGAEIGDAVVDFVKRRRIPHTFLVAYWSLYEKAVGQQRLEASLTRTIQALQATGTQVCVILDVPAHETDTTRALMRSYIFHQRIWDASACSEVDHRAKNSALYHLASISSSAIFIDPAPSMLDAGSKRYRMTSQGIPLYFDKNHLSEYGVMTVILPTLENAFATKFHVSN